MEPEKVEKYADLYLVGIDLEGYNTQEAVNICSVCYAVVSVAWDHWEKHVEWHNNLRRKENNG